MTGSRVVFGLGANVGDPLAQLREAVRLVRSSLDAEAPISGLYRSAPIGPKQPDFLNSAMLVRTQESPMDLLGVVQAVEAALGRVRDRHHGPRTIDVDVLWADFVSDHPRLRVPHPELKRRAFAWLPCVELVPELATEALSFHGQWIERIASADWVMSDPPRKFPS